MMLCFCGVLMLIVVFSKMQAAGSPPEELISNPLMEDLGAMGGLGGGPGGVPDCPQQ